LDIVVLYTTNLSITQTLYAQPTQLKEIKYLGTSDSIKRSDLQTGIQMCNAGLIAQTLQHHAQVNLASQVEVPVLFYLRSSCSRITTSEGP